MSDNEIAKIKEWNKVQLLTVALVCLAVLGAVREYLHISTPSDEAVLVYHFGGDNAQSVMEIKAPEPQPQPQPEAEPQSQPEAEPQPQPEAATVDNNANALPEFLDYMHEMQEKAATITFDGTVLDKIHQSENVAQPEPQPVAEEHNAENAQPAPTVVKEENAAVATPDEASVIEKAKTDVINNVLDNVDQIVADSAALSENEQMQDDDDAAIAEYINREQEAEDAARQQMSEELGAVDGEDENAPIVLLPGVLDQQ